MEKVLRWMATYGSQLTLDTNDSGDVLIQLDTMRNGRPLLQSEIILPGSVIRESGRLSGGDRLVFTDAVERMVELQEQQIQEDAVNANDQEAERAPGSAQAQRG